jgi:hypothetical protein
MELTIITIDNTAVSNNMFVIEKDSSPGQSTVILFDENFTNAGATAFEKLMSEEIITAEQRDNLVALRRAKYNSNTGQKRRDQYKNYCASLESHIETLSAILPSLEQQILTLEARNNTLSTEYLSLLGVYPEGPRLAAPARSSLFYHYPSPDFQSSEPATFSMGN